MLRPRCRYGNAGRLRCAHDVVNLHSTHVEQSSKDALLKTHLLNGAKLQIGGGATVR